MKNSSQTARWALVLGLLIGSICARALAVDLWYESLHPATRVAFEKHAGDYIAVNGYLWSQRSFNWFIARVDMDDPYHPLHQAVFSDTPFFYDPVTNHAHMTPAEVYATTPGVERLVAKVQAIHEDGTLVRQKDGRLAMLFDHNRDRVDGDWIDAPVMAMGRYQFNSPDGTPRTIAKYELAIVDKAVSAQQLAHWFNDHGIRHFVYFELKRVVDRTAKKKDQRVYKWIRRNVVVPFFTPGTPGTGTP